MEISTAIKILHKECDFLGKGMLDVIDDIQKHGHTLYSNQVVVACNVYIASRRKVTFTI
jgi:hypothetical protein